MKFTYAVLLFLLLAATPAFANICGFIELANGDLLEVQKGRVYDLNQNLLAESVPAAKKVSLESEFGQVLIDTVKNKRKGKQIRIKLNFIGGQSSALLVPQAGSLVFFDNSDSSLVLIDLKEGTVARAVIGNGKSKLKFIENEDEFFSKDIC